MSGNDPLPTGTPMGDWGLCSSDGCTGRVLVERDSTLCDEHWEQVIRADEREQRDTYWQGRLENSWKQLDDAGMEGLRHAQRWIDLRAKVDALYDQGRTRDWDYFAALGAVVALIEETK